MTSNNTNNLNPIAPRKAHQNQDPTLYVSTIHRMNSTLGDDLDTTVFTFICGMQTVPLASMQPKTQLVLVCMLGNEEVDKPCTVN